MSEGINEAEIISKEDDVIDPLPMGLRNRFQIKVFSALINASLLDENNMDEMRHYGKIISDYIDHTKNKDIRDSISNDKTNNFTEAVKLMMIEINRQGGLLEKERNKGNMQIAA
jgi:hypothetical protein